MKQDDAKHAVIRLWGKREKGCNTELDILDLYNDIEKNHPELLKFKCSGDKYQRIKAWIIPYVV